VSEDAEQTQTLPTISSHTPSALTLFYDPPGTLRLTVDDSHSYATVKLFQAAPLSSPGRYLSLLSGKGEEIATIATLEDLPSASREVAQADLQRRYLTATVGAIANIKTEFGITYWHVSTNRGDRDFVIQNLSESCVWLSDRHILLIDVDGNRFEIPDRETLDIDSRKRLDAVL